MKKKNIDNMKKNIKKNKIQNTKYKIYHCDDNGFWMLTILQLQKG